MRRILLDSRPELVQRFLLEWQSVDNQLPEPLLLGGGYGRLQLQEQWDQYAAWEDEIREHAQESRGVIADRDFLWNGNGRDLRGIHFYLRLYKDNVLARLGFHDAHSRLVPVVGAVQVQRYLAICDQFLAHWQSVNEVLDPPLRLGTYGLENLQADRQQLAGILAEMESRQRAMQLLRQEQERLFGDEASDRRDPNSIVSRLLQFHLAVRMTLGDGPWVDRLPSIFPKQKSSVRPGFRWSFSRDEHGKLRTRIENPGLKDAKEAHLKIGGVLLTQALPEKPGDVVELVWPDAPAEAVPDKLNLRNARHHVVARGRHDPGFTV